MKDILAMARVSLFGSANKAGVSFDATRDIPSLAGKVILITGGAGDLGKQAAIDFARHGPAHIYIADLPRADQGAAVIAQIQEAAPDARVSFLELDLGSFDSIQKAAAEFRSAETRLDICVLNAGVMRVKTGMTADGYEFSFGINYLGHALLTKLLLPTLLATAQQPGTDVRVVIVSSEGHTMAPREGIVFAKLKTSGDDMKYFERYGQSKLANVYLARELAREYPQLTVAAVHPGRIITQLAYGLRKESFLVLLATPIAPLICSSIEVGVRNHLWASTAAGVQSGKYYEPVGVPDKESALAKDEKLSTRLWEWTANELKGRE